MCAHANTKHAHVQRYKKTTKPPSPGNVFPLHAPDRLQLQITEHIVMGARKAATGRARCYKHKGIDIYKLYNK